MTMDARVWVLQRDVDNLKMRDAELKAFQEKIIESYYKIDGLERSIENHSEQLEETSDFIRESTRDMLKKIEDVLAKSESKNGSKKEDKELKTELINNIAKIIFALLTIIGSSLLGIKVLGG